jgi:hypothetical protein
VANGENHVTYYILVIRGKEGFVMAIKVVLQFNGVTDASASMPLIGFTGDAHAFGFTESYWRDLTNSAAVVRWLKDEVGPARARLLPSQVKLTSALMYTSGGGRGVVVPIGIQGTAGSTDQVNIGALASTRHSTAAVQRRWWLHCLPDSWVIGGELSISLFQAQAISMFFSSISQAYWLGIVRGNLQTMLTVTAAGLVTLAGNSPYAVGQQLQVNRTLTTDGRRKGGKFIVSAVGPLASQFTLGGWEFGATTGGQIFQPSYQLYNIGANEGPYIERVGSKRVGRPLNLYRGRQSVRRT